MSSLWDDDINNLFLIGDVMKHVTVGITVDTEFVRLLRASVGMKRLGPDLNRQHTPIEVLAVVFLAEARGAIPEQTHSLIPPEWRPHIEAVTELRKVEEL